MPYTLALILPILLILLILLICRLHILLGIALRIVCQLRLGLSQEHYQHNEDRRHTYDRGEESEQSLHRHPADKHHDKHDEEHQRSSGEVLRQHQSYECQARTHDILKGLWRHPFWCLQLTQNTGGSEHQRTLGYL